MIRLIFSLTFLIPMCLSDIRSRNVPIYLSVLFLVGAIVFNQSIRTNPELNEITYISTAIIAILVLFSASAKNHIGGADVLTILAFIFIFSIPVTIMILILAIGLSFFYIFLTKNKNIPFILPLSVAMTLIDLFNPN